MRLLWVWVFVGVAGGVAKEKGRLLTVKEILNPPDATAEERRTEEERQEACRREEDVELCKNGFLFAATALGELGSGGELAVTLSLERSLHPHVTFDLSLRSLGDRDQEELEREEEVEEWAEEKVLAREEVTLGVSELRRVELRVSDLAWRTAYLVVTALPVGHTDSGKHTFQRIQKVTSGVDVFVQTDKSEYAPGDTVDYRAVVVDGNVDKSPKFAQVILKPNSFSFFPFFPSRREETRLPWVEVPASGIVKGNFTFTGPTHVRVHVTSDVTSSDASVAATPNLLNADRSNFFMSARFERLSDVSFTQPRVKGLVTLTSPEGLPLEGTCNVTISHSSSEKTVFAKRKVERGVSLGLAGGDFEFDVREELGAQQEDAEEYTALFLKAKCSDRQSGGYAEAAESISLWKNPFRVRRLPVRNLRGGNSSHPQSTVGLKFLVERWDGGSVEEEEPKKGLQVKLLLSKENLDRLRPSATNFSLPIPPSGVVNLEFQVMDTHPARWNDTILMRVGDAEADATLEGRPVPLFLDMRVTPVDPARLVRKGDVVRFHVRSCLPYASVNVILSSFNTIYASQRFSFSPEGDELDEVIELTIPQNVTEGTLNLLVYGLTTTPQDEGFKLGDRASVEVNVVPSNGPQNIRIVDQVDVDMSTIVTFRLEGMLADSVVSLQAAKLESPEDEIERSSKLHGNQNLTECENPEIRIFDFFLDSSDPRDITISGNFFVKPTKSIRHPPLVFVDVDRKTSTEDNGTFTGTKIFDRLTEFGTYVVSGETSNSKSGRTVFSSSPVLKIPASPVTLSLSVAPSVLLGETVEVLGYVKNNLATPYEGHVTLETREGGSIEVREEFVKVNPNAFEFLRMNVTPQIVGDFFVSLSSNISSRLTATKKVSVTHLNSNTQIH